MVESGARWGEKKNESGRGRLRKETRTNRWEIFLEPFEFLQRHVSFFEGPYLV